MFHELAHHAHGHCRYVNSLGIHFIMELGASDDDDIGAEKNDPIMRQALEVDADIYAALLTWSLRIRAPSDSQLTRRAMLERGTEIVVPKELFMRDWIFAIFIMFWMFDYDFNVDDFRTRKHPAPPQRASLAFAGIMGAAEKLSDRETNIKVERAFNRNDAIIALLLITDQKILPKIEAYIKLEDEGRGPLARHYTELVMPKIAELQPTLKQYGSRDVPLAM